MRVAEAIGCRRRISALWAASKRGDGTARLGCRQAAARLRACVRRRRRSRPKRKRPPRPTPKAAGRGRRSSDEAEGRRSRASPPPRHLKPPDRKAQQQFHRSRQPHPCRRRDGFIQGYNAQVAVDATAQLIIAYGLDAKQRDADINCRRSPCARASVQANPARSLHANLSAELSADAASRRLTLPRWPAREIDAYIAPGRAQAWRRRPASKRRARRSACRCHGHESIRRAGTAQPLPPTESRSPEPVFGQIKQARGFRQFLLRGLEKVANEWGLVCLAHNIFEARPGADLVPCRTRNRLSFATSETVQRTMAAKLPPLHQTGCANLLHPALRLA